MTIGLLQSTLFGDLFGTAVMRAVFGEPAFIAHCIEGRGGAGAGAGTGRDRAEGRRRSDLAGRKEPP